MQTLNPSYWSRLLTLLCLLLLTTFGPLSSQSNLGAGDVAFTLLNSEGNNDDAFAFVLLTPVEAGTVVRVTDREYATGAGFTETSEGVLTITFNQAYACGLEVFITDSNPANDQYDFTASEPGISVSPNVDNGFQLSTAGETLVMFRGNDLVNPCPTCFITALANTGVGFGQAATGSGDLPPGLTVGTSAMAMTADPDGNEWDNIKYDCSTTQADPADLRAALMAPANWLTDNDAALPVTPCVPSFSCSAPCIAPVINSVTVTDCGNGPNGLVTLTVNGQLNGAANWEWRVPNNGTNEQPCDQQLNLGSGPTFTAQFLLPDLTFYVVATGGCLSEDVCFAYVPAEVLGVPAFAPLTDLCATSGVQSGLGGATPTGGVYSGTGVTDDGNGMTFSFDPAAAGAGDQTVTYTITIPNNPCGETSTSQTIEVLAAPNVSMSTGALTVAVDAPVQTMLGGGTPTGGTYSGSGVTDNGDGMTYTFDPAVAGVGVTQVTYTFADANGCSNTASDAITVEGNAVAGNECSDATDLSALFGQPVGEAQTSGLFNNDDATTEPSDPTTGFECFGEPDGPGGSPELNRTLWFTFTGDGETYDITTVECTATDYIDLGDTQIAIYTGDCGSLMGVACNEDGPLAQPGGPFPSEVTFPTEVGVEYRMIIDGFGGNFPADGEFCVQVTRSTDVSVTNVAQTDISVFPNPTSGLLSLRGVNAHRIDVYDHIGRLVTSQVDQSNEVDLAGFSAGVYLLKIHSDERVYSAKVVKE